MDDEDIPATVFGGRSGVLGLFQHLFAASESVHSDCRYGCQPLDNARKRHRHSGIGLFQEHLFKSGNAEFAWDFCLAHIWKSNS